MTKPDTQSDKRDHSKDALKDQHKNDPRAELGLKSPLKDQESKNNSQGTANTKAQGPEIETVYDGNPNPTGSDSSLLGPKDDTPLRLKKVKGPRSDNC